MRFVMYGSTRSVTDNHGVQESYYDYDIFGSPITGNYTTGTDYGYLGKPYDSITGLYNYGYRDYSPQTVRFTTVDPIRDGANWFAYVNNDPVNYVDLWGLLASEQKNIITSYGFGFKMALGVGLGFEVGYIEAGETKGIYITGSYGVGVQVSTGNYSSIKDLVKSPSPRSLFSPSIGTGSVTIGTETSETVDIGVGIVGTWDLNNLNKSGLPNSWSGGSVGGGYWYNSTTILKIGRDEK